MCAVNGQQQQSQKMEGRQAVLLEAKAMSQRGKSELVRAGKQQPSGGMRRLKAIKIPVESISIVYTHTQADERKTSGHIDNNDVGGGSFCIFIERVETCCRRPRRDIDAE